MSVTFLIAGPGFGKTTALQKAIAQWNMNDSRSQAIVQCLAGDSHSPVLQKIQQQWMESNPLAEDQATATFLNNTQLLSIEDEAQLIEELIDKMQAGDELWVSSTRLPAITLVRWQHSHDIQLKQETEFMLSSDGEWPLVFEMRKNSWHQGAVEAQVKQYLEKEYFIHLQEKDIALLARLALFEQLTPDLWDKLNLKVGSLFDQWQKFRFLHPTSVDSEVYVWVPEFRKVLLEKYAADLDARNQILSQACDHWVRHGCFKLLIDTLYDDSEQYLDNEDVIIPLVIALVFTRRFHQAKFVLEQMDEVANSEHQQKIIAVLSQTLALFTTAEGERADKLTALGRINSSNNVIHCLGMLLSAYQAFYQGDLDAAAQQAKETLLYMNEQQQVYLSSLTEMLLIACDKYRGYTLQAAQQLVLAFNNKEERPEDPAWQNYAAGMLIFYYEKNDLISARLLCEQVLPHINNACSTEVIVHFYLYYARILEIVGDVEGSFEYLIRLQRFLSLGSYPRYQGKMVAERMRQSVAKNDKKSMRYLHDKFNLAEAEAYQHTPMLLDVRDYMSQAHAMQLLALGQYDAAIALLIPLRDTLLKKDYQERALVTEAQIVVAYWQKGEQELAENQLIEAVSFYGWLLFHRGLLDEVSGVIPILSGLINQGRLKPTAIYIKLFESVLQLNDKATDLHSVKKYESLTSKEQQVMASLAEGLSNQNIAQKLDVAPTTVKWHLKNIYRKLALKNRSSAIAFMHKIQPAP